ncbi:gag-pol polyprotein [Tanacetum coccineum]
MSNSNTNLQTQSSNALHNAIMEAGSKDRPPMLAPGNYVQWKSRIKRYIDTKPNSELIHHCLQNPPYTYQWAEKTVPVAEGSSETTTERYMENYKNVSQDIRDQLNAEAEAVQIILTGIDNDIYSTVDACPNACEMWKAIERLKQGESINVQDLETNLYWEFGKFTSRDGESLESYYSRFYKMMNELVRNQCHVTNHQVNVQFLLQLQPEWKNFVTLNEVNKIRAEGLARTANPLALVAQQQPDKDIDKLMALVSLSFKKIYKPTNNNLRTSSNTSKVNQDNSPRINRGTGYDNQRVVNVTGARENVARRDNSIHRRLWVLKAHDQKIQTSNCIMWRNFMGTFCDADLEVAFRKSTCYIRDLKGNDLLQGSRGTDLYSITLQDSTTPNPICLMAKATSSQAWLWHQALCKNVIKLKEALEKQTCEWQNFTVIRNKTRLLANGICSKRKGKDIDFEESFAPVSRLEAVRKFEMSMMGEMKFFLGIQIHQSPCGIFINQAKYAQEILKKHGMTSCDSIGTPIATKHLDANLSGTPIDQTKYLVWSETHVTYSSRLDIIHEHVIVLRYSSENVVEKHLTAVKRIFRYLKDSINMGLWYPKDTGFELTTFSDSDQAGCLNLRKRTSGGIQFLGGDKAVS